MAIAKLNFGSVDVGRVDLPQNDLAKSLMQYGTQLNENERNRRLDAQRMAESQSNMLMNQARFSREQDLNKRQDLEYNRELGLRDMRKTLAAEYEANPYADIWGGGAANKMLDKQVLDYVDSGKEITPEIATKLQGLYETNRPFKEDLSQVFRSKLLAAGEDPTKADAYAKSMTDSMPFSRATQQAQLDKQQEIQQGYYNAVAAANKDMAKIEYDISKTNQANKMDLLKNKTDMQKTLIANSGIGASGGGGSGKSDSVGGYTGLMDIASKLGSSDADTFLNSVKTMQGIMKEDGKTRKYTDEQLYKAATTSVDPGGRHILSLIPFTNDTTFNNEAFTTRLANLPPVIRYDSVNPFGSNNDVEDIQTKVSAKDLLAQFAPRQIASYNPEGMLERAKTAVPELFPQTNVSSNETSSTSGSSKPNGTYPTSGKDGYDATRRYIESSSVGSKVNYAAGTNGDESFNPDGSVKNKNQAIGADQFLPSTLQGYKGKHGLPNFTDQEFVSNPELQNEVARIHTDKNVQHLKNRGIEVNDYTKWLAHNLGAGNVKSFVDGKETDQLKSAMSAQFGGKSTSIEDYNNHFKKFFEGDIKPTSKNVADFVSSHERNVMVDSKTPVTTGTDVNTRYDALQSMIEPTLGAKTELTLGKKEELINKYEPVIDKVRSDYLDNNGGPWDSNKATVNIMHSLGISRPKAENLYETITKDLKSNSVMNDAIAESNRTGVPISETDAYLKTSPSKLFSKVNNDRLAEIERALGDNPAPTVENQLLINERANILRRNMSAGSTVKGIKDNLIKNIINTTGIGSGISTR